jgi:hypothetical protein
LEPTGGGLLLLPSVGVLLPWPWVVVVLVLVLVLVFVFGGGGFVLAYLVIILKVEVLVLSRCSMKYKPQRDEHTSSPKHLERSSASKAATQPHLHPSR